MGKEIKRIVVEKLALTSVEELSGIIGTVSKFSHESYMRATLAPEACRVRMGIQSCLECPLDDCREGEVRNTWRKIEKALDIKRDRAKGMSIKELGVKYGLSRRTVFRALREGK